MSGSPFADNVRRMQYRGRASIAPDIPGRIAPAWKATAVLITLFAVVALAGCSTIDAGACPPLKEYTPEQNERLAQELETLPGDAITLDVIADYMLLRDQVRACQ
jgi:hypothetical protein